MIEEHWYAVRCCCKPEKILGFIRLFVPSHCGLHTVVDTTGSSHQIELRNFQERAPKPPAEQTYGSSFLETSPHLVERAVYAENRPVEFWRQFPNFMEIAGPAVPLRAFPAAED